jgi:hypothetical protein
MKAIETKYKGYRFRSRLEARWAVFFDALGVKWEYEPEGFDMGIAGWYLPDFRVTSPQKLITWYEVKPTKENDDGKMKSLERFYYASPKDDEAQRDSFVVLCGDPLEFMGNEPYKCVCPRCGTIDSSMTRIDGESYYCYPCDTDTPCGSGNPPEKGIIDDIVVYPHKGFLLLLDPHSIDNWSYHVLLAAEKARQARFEHGECGL